jgi:hypothetical protein
MNRPSKCIHTTAAFWGKRYLRALYHKIAWLVIFLPRQYSADSSSITLEVWQTF